MLTERLRTRPVSCAQSAPSREGSDEMDGSQAALDSPGAQYRRRKQHEQERSALDRHCAGGSAASSERSSRDGSERASGSVMDRGVAGASAEPRQVPKSCAAISAPQQRSHAGGSPPTPDHAGIRGRGLLAFGNGDGKRAMALAARFDSIVAGSRAHHPVAGLRGSPDITPSPSPLQNAGW